MQKKEDESINYQRQFEQNEMHTTIKQENKFQDLLNLCISQKIKKAKMLKDLKPIKYELKTEKQQEIEINSVQQMTEQMLNYQTTLIRRHDQVIRAKLQFEKKINQLRETISNFKQVEVKSVQKKNEKVVKLLSVTHNRMDMFQSLTERYRVGEIKRSESRKKDLDKQQDELRAQEAKIALFKQQIREQKKILLQLKEEEEKKKTKLRECFQIGEYIEFFMEIKMMFIDQIQESDSSCSGFTNVNTPIRNRQSTRNEIVSMLDDFYNSQDLNIVVENTISTYNEMIQQQNGLRLEYNSKIEEKQIKFKQLQDIEQIIKQQKEENIEYIGLIPQEVDEITLNQAIIEGPTIVHQNMQLKYHIKINQFCLISIYMKIVDLIQRMCIALIWLEETTKILPKSLDILCNKFLKQYSKSKLQLFIPKPVKPTIKQQQQQGQFIPLKNRSYSPISSQQSIISETSYDQDLSAYQDQLTHFNKLADYQIIADAWQQIVKEDQLTYKFVADYNLDKISINQPTQDIICQMYLLFANIVKSTKYINHYINLFQYYKDIMKQIYKSKGLEKKSTQLKINNKSMTESQDLNNQYYINVSKQNQLMRIISQKHPVYDDDHSEPEKKILKTQDEQKYNEYFILESNRIQKKNPLIHDKLMTKALLNIDLMRKKELNDNYQTSDQAISDADYLNQERRNIKGILSKKVSHTASRQTTQVEDDSFSSQQSKIIKNIGLLQKISKLNALNRNQSYKNLNKSLQQSNQNIKRKISEYFTSIDQQSTIINQDQRSNSIKKLTVRYPPLNIDNKSNVSKSQEPSDKISQQPTNSERCINVKQSVYTADSTFSLLFNSTKGKSFISKFPNN